MKTKFKNVYSSSRDQISRKEKINRSNMRSYRSNIKHNRKSTQEKRIQKERSNVFNTDSLSETEDGTKYKTERHGDSKKVPKIPNV